MQGIPKNDINGYAREGARLDMPRRIIGTTSQQGRMRWGEELQLRAADESLPCQQSHKQKTLCAGSRLQVSSRTSRSHLAQCTTSAVSTIVHRLHIWRDAD
jgi:hypothetical protein